MDPDAYEAIARIRDFFIHCGKLGEELDKIVKRGVKKSDQEEKERFFDVSKIKWTEKVGDKGPYQKASMNDNPDNKDFSALILELENQDKKTKFHQGMFYWLFTSGDAVGRKKLYKKT